MINKEDILDKIERLLSELSGQCGQLKDGLDDAGLTFFEVNALYLSGHIAVLKKLLENSESRPTATPALTGTNENQEAAVQEDHPDEYTEDIAQEEDNEPYTIEQSPIAGVDIPETEEPEQQEERIDAAADVDAEEAPSEREGTDEESYEKVDEQEEAAALYDEVLGKEQDDESPVMRYVEEQEVEETLFTPATAGLDDDDEAEEFTLEGSKQESKESPGSESEGETVDENTTAEEAADKKEGPEEAVDESTTVEEVAEEDPEESMEENTTLEEAADEKEEPEEVSEEVEAGDEEREEPSDRLEQEEPAAGAEEKLANEAASEEPKYKEVIIEEKEVVIPRVEEPSPQAAARPLSLNDLFSAQRKKEQEQASPPAAPHTEGPAPSATKRIQDLKSAVSLNDKLLFIKDLFNGYSLAYSEAMELLGRYDSFADAEAFLQETYAGKNNWASKQATVEKFYALLQQRYRA